MPIEASGFVEGSLSDAIDAASDAIDAAADEPIAGFDESTAGFDESTAGFDESTAGFDESTVGFVEPTAAEFSTGVSQIAWWARLGSRFRQYADDFDVRWIEPSGRIVLERSAKKRGADTIGSVLGFGRKNPAAAGRWTLELVLEDDAVDRQTFMIRPQPSTLQPL